MFIMWISFSIHYPIATVLGDLCTALDEELSQDAGTTTKVVDTLVRCNNIPEFQELLDLADRALNLTVSTGIL